ncbi:probable calcium-binding protein CML41 [Aristolochia californica]|uniref:probable calcium-binding protein CML41 n=1 Tax=Aristolochia californica TaxID=171875 RepID=UPI0035D61605
MAKWLSLSTMTSKLNFPGHRRRSSFPASPASPATSFKEPQDLLEVFRCFDGDGDGKISSHELRTFFTSRGEVISLDMVEAVISELDSDADGLLDYNDFLRLVDTGEGDNQIEKKNEDLKIAFEMYEVERGSGCITPKSLQRILNQLGDDKSLDELMRTYTKGRKKVHGAGTCRLFH